MDRFSLLTLCLCLVACSGTSEDSPDSTTSCQETALVEVGIFGDDTCTGTPMLTYTLDISKTCSGWTREGRGQTIYNSGSRFQCYRDRLCYTQFVETLSCDGTRATDKEVSTTECIKDQTPNIWVKIMGGTEGCPEAPAGFACPISEPFEGNRTPAAACQL
jgi:hypothetical protein